MLWSILYTFIAGLCDFYFLAFVLGALVASATMFLDRPVPPLFLFAELGVLLLATLIYHIALAKRVAWLSPGEQLTGRILVDGEKVWTNPYGRNRWALLAVILLTLVLQNGAWDDLGTGQIYNQFEILGKCFWLWILCAGLVRMGQGRSHLPGPGCRRRYHLG